MKFGTSTKSHLRALLPVTAALVLALTACGQDGDAETEQNQESAAEESPAQEPATEEEEDGPELEFALPEDCEAAGAAEVALSYLPEDTEQVSEELEEGQVRCPFASQEGQRGINLAYAETDMTLADMPDIEDNYETVGEVQEIDLYMTDRVSDLGGVLEDVDMGDADTGRGVRLHLPGGLFITAVSVGAEDIDQALPQEELDDVIADAAEQLV